MNKLAKRKQKGFTLIELIAVIAIIGILAAVLVPRVLGYMNDAKDSKVIAQARNVRMAYETMISKGSNLGDEDTVDITAVAGEFTTPTAPGVSNWAEYTSVNPTDYDQLDSGATMAQLKAATTGAATALDEVKAK